MQTQKVEGGQAAGGWPAQPGQMLQVPVLASHRLTLPRTALAPPTSAPRPRPAGQGAGTVLLAPDSPGLLSHRAATRCPLWWGRLPREALRLAQGEPSAGSLGVCPLWTVNTGHRLHLVQGRPGACSGGHGAAWWRQPVLHRKLWVAGGEMRGTPGRRDSGRAGVPQPVPREKAAPHGWVAARNLCP